MDSITFKKTAASACLTAMWKEIDDKTFGKGLDCCDNLRAFIDTGFTARHDVVEYRDSPLLKVFRGKVAMTPDDRARPAVRPTMSHFFYMDERNPSKVIQWIGAVGPVGF